MGLVDSHCHLDCLDLEALGTDLPGVIAEAGAAGVDGMLCVAIDPEGQDAVLAIARRFPSVHATAGVHPNVDADPEPSVESLLALAEDPVVVGIGETGLDYFRTPPEGRGRQQRRFRVHIEAARRAGLPLVVHARDADEDTMRILADAGADTVGGVMHCFVGGREMAERALAMGFYISFSGILTFRNAEDLRAVAREIPLDRLLIETDSPYLAPVPYRGRTNRPAYVVEVARQLAELRGLTVDEIARLTTANYHRLFARIQASVPEDESRGSVG